MADLPENPNNRTEEYLADIAGLPNEKPDNPWSRKEAYLDKISGRMDGMEEQIAALATDLSFKGSVESEADLPTGAATGDTYITEDTGVMYVWTEEDWVALGGTGINVVQTTGTSTTDVMSQDATTSMVYSDPSARKKIRIGYNSKADYDYQVSIGAPCTINSTTPCTAIGYNAYVSGNYSMAIGTDNPRVTADRATALGHNATVTANGGVAVGSGASAQQQGEFNIGSGNIYYGYNNTNYRLLTGVHDPVNAHDAATKGYVDTLVGDIETALHAINNGGNA